MKWVLVLIGWVGPKVNRLDLGSGFWFELVGFRPRVNGLDLI